MLWMMYWCPEEDVALAKLSRKNSALRGDQLSKVVPKAVPIEGCGWWLCNDKGAVKTAPFALCF